MLETRRQATELMDDPDLEADDYGQVLGDLDSVNRMTMAHRPTLRFLDKAAGKLERFTLLDVGFGHGDMLCAIARWAERRGIEAELTGIDVNPRSARFARAATDPRLSIRYLTGDYLDLTGRQFDFVISSLVTHHMTHEELLAFLRYMESEARIGWFVNDLHRHTVSYLAWPVIASAMRWHEIVRKDGHTSIARSFRIEDWQALLSEAQVDGALIERYFPYRLCVTKIR